MAEGGDWADLIKILTAGKVNQSTVECVRDPGADMQAILLLPTTPASSLPVTPQILRDHILFTAQLSGCMTPRHEKQGIDASPNIAVSLSGMVGTYTKYVKPPNRTS